MDDRRVDRPSSGGVTAQRFSLRQLFCSLTLTAIGLAMIGGLAPREFDLTPSLANIAAALSWLGAGMLLGAGLLLPFNRPVLGAVLGFAVPFLIYACTLISVSPYLFGVLTAGALVAGTLWLITWLERGHKLSDVVPQRFSLRTLLVTTTLVAVVLGLIVYVVR